MKSHDKREVHMRVIRKISRIAAVTALFASSLFISSCGTQSFSLISSEATDYKIIVATTVPLRVWGTISELQKTIHEKTNVRLLIQRDTANPVQADEILIGSTDRGNADLSVGQNEYSIRTTDSKVIISGGSSKAIIEGIHEFMATYLNNGGTKLKIPENQYVKKEIQLIAGWNGQLDYSGNGVTLLYQIYLPEGYTASKKYPLLLFLHGDGLCGEDDEKQLSNEESTLVKRAVREYGECIILAPQSPSKWLDSGSSNDNYIQSKAVMSPYLMDAMELLADTAGRFPVDNKKIYLMGYSRGAFASWYLLGKYPDKFAAAVIVSGAGDPAMASLIKDIPIWVFHGDKDNVVAYSNAVKMVDALIAAGGSPHFTTGYNSGHGLGNTLSQTKDVISWLFSQSK